MKTIEQCYEELRSIIDGGSESFTHEDAVQYLKDKLAQQEPDDLTIAYMAGLSRGKDLAPQRTWVGLTGEEHIALFEKYGHRTGELVGAVEDKLKEKNT